MKTRLNYLLELDMLGTTIRFASNGETTYQGDNYMDGLSVTSVSEAELRCKLPNHKHEGASLFLNAPVRNAPVRLYLLLDGVKRLKFAGVGDCLTSLTNDRADIRAIAIFGESRFPNVRIAPPLFNHITPAGSIIAFGGQEIEVE